MSIPATIAPFWRSYSDAVGGVDEARLYDVSYFGDSEGLANALLALILAGVKRATTGSLWASQHSGTPPPAPGALSVVTDWSGTPRCIIETLSIEIVSFADVTPEFAATEGEGDGSLSFWREAHREYFTRECIAAGRTFNEDMLVVCERFRVVYRST